MARGKVTGGGDYADWVAIGEHEPLVMFRRVRQLPDEDLGNGMTHIVLADSVVCTGPDAGKILLSEKLAGRAMVNELLRQNDGDDLPCKVVVKQRAGKDYAAIVSVTSDEEAKIDEIFPPGSEDAVWAEVAEKSKADKAAAGDDAPAASTNGAASSGDKAAAPAARRKPW